MIKKIFETIRPVFFISDKKEFDFCPFDLSGVEDIPFSSTGNTVSIFCLPLFDEGDSNEVFIYLNEHPMQNEMVHFSPIFNGKLNLPSKSIEISDSDTFVIFEKAFDTNVIHLAIFAEKDYKGDGPSKFIVIINDKIPVLFESDK